MDDLEEEMLRKRIERVEEDIAGLTSGGDNSRKLEVLNEYKRYLEDELKQLRDEKHQKT